MIKLTTVSIDEGVTVLTFTYSLQGSPNQIVKIPEREIAKLLQDFWDLTGLKPTLQDLRNILIQLISDARKGDRRFIEKINYAQFVGVDLEL